MKTEFHSQTKGEYNMYGRVTKYFQDREYGFIKCYIIPQTLNTMLSNYKKHRLPKWKTAKMDLPLGVRYDNRIKMYYGEIRPYGHDEVIRLSYWDTPEEASYVEDWE